MSETFAHPLLSVPTPRSWIAQACVSEDTLLIDHANCEKKAASTALALMFAYAEDLELTATMSRLAREELRHYEEVARLIQRLEMRPRRLAPGRYAALLRGLVAHEEPQRQVDLLICGAFIEARSCERFAALSAAIGAPLRELFQGLGASEARHFSVYLDLARRAAGRAGIEVAARISDFARVEAELILGPDPVFRFHSGAPAQSACAAHGVGGRHRAPLASGGAI
ncbi:MAG TPA: tRNA isopentenyl-2-thiomethyl-A-37 hydroxylase MiaE [Steroidobacteraceae bacterium]|nr:tRNA isopentenyl-2-thiomethyl-A-37 hydroxylase MiaE [Steroidobacteraceae bacterium]